MLCMDHVDQIIAQWRAERPDLDTGPMALVGRLRRLSNHMAAEMEKTFAAHGLKPADFDVLATLRRHGAPYALSPGALIASTMVTSGTMTHRLDRLEAMGLVARHANTNDRRAVEVQLTAEGLARIEAALADHVATQTRLVAPLDAEARTTLNTLLRMLTEA